MKILLTAFEPFGGEKVNPAQEALKDVPDVVAGAGIVKLTVPTVFGKSVETVYGAMKREKPDAVLCIGQAAGRTGLTVERVAINLHDRSDIFGTFHAPFNLETRDARLNQLRQKFQRV